MANPYQNRPLNDFRRRPVPSGPVPYDPREDPYHPAYQTAGYGDPRTAIPDIPATAPPAPPPVTDPVTSLGADTWRGDGGWEGDSATTAPPAPPAPTTTSAPSTYPTPSPTPGTYDYAAWAITEAYKKHLGRTPSQTEINSHLGGGRNFAQTNIDNAIRTIQQSEEARQHSTQTTSTTPPPTGPSGSTGTGHNVEYTGFPTDRAKDIDKSAKDAFEHYSRTAPRPPVEDKKALEAWFIEFIKPKMEAHGHKIISVVGDQVTFENWQGRWTIDYAQNAGAPGARLQWHVPEGVTGQGAGARPYTPPGQTPPAGPTPPPPNASGPPAPEPPENDRLNVGMSPVAYERLVDSPLSDLNTWRRSRQGAR